MCGGLQFKNIEVPVLLVFHGPSDPERDVVEGDGGDAAGRLLQACKVTGFGEQALQRSPLLREDSTAPGAAAVCRRFHDRPQNCLLLRKVN